MAPTTYLAAETLRLKPVGRAEQEGHEPVTLSKQASVLLGRGRGCDICLADPTISRRHASIVQRDGRWYVVDLGGRLGTNLNGIRLEAEHPTLVAPGDYMRAGPYSFRFDLGTADGSTITSTMRAVTPGTIVERVPQRDLGAMAQRRLDLLIEGAAAIHRATAEAGLAAALVELLLEGTGYPRSAVLRALGSTEQVEVIACGDRDEGMRQGDSAGFTFSQSLLREASGGGVARISQQVPAHGQSIERLGITAALCAPIMRSPTSCEASWRSASSGSKRIFAGPGRPRRSSGRAPTA
jgi:predicted component of type VI protein secretion system